MKKDHLIIVRGGGDLATGTIFRLHAAGFKVLVLETEHPAAIRRTVSFCEAVYEGKAAVEGTEAVKIEALSRMDTVFAEDRIPVLVDPEGNAVEAVKPDAVVDAILAKKNLGTTRRMAPLTIALGPGFTAGKDVDAVIETMRGHNLGRIIREGCALPDTGVPGMIAGHAADRVIHAPADGIFHNISRIGSLTEKGREIAWVESVNGHVPVNASLTGILRGLLREGYPVTRGFKIADIDPRLEQVKNCYTISDKARCIAGSVLEVICAQLCE